MDVSFILSSDEIFTLMSLMPGKTDAGRQFAEGALVGAVFCDLSGLVEKRLARMVGDELEIVPVLRMLVDSLARADSAELRGEAWVMCSPWVTVQCSPYPYRDGDWKITPVQKST